VVGGRVVCLGGWDEGGRWGGVSGMGGVDVSDNHNGDL